MYNIEPQEIKAELIKIEETYSGSENSQVYPSSGKTISKKLEEIQLLKDQGVITEEEYRLKRNSILEQF